MWDMAKSSIGLFLTGKLFSQPGKAYGLLALGVGLTAGLFVAVRKVGAPLPVAAGVAAFIGGALQPRLYKTLKYR